MSRWVDSGFPPVAQRRRNHQDAVEVVAGLRECCRLLGIEQPPARGLNVSMARGLAAFAACFPINPVTGVAPWVDIPEWKATVGLWQSNDAAQLRHWGLIESKASVVRRSNMADDAPDRAHVGIWRITADGMRFAQGRLAVQRFAVQYDQNLIGLAGERITIREVRKFTYEDLPVAPALLAALLSDA